VIGSGRRRPGTYVLAPAFDAATVHGWLRSEKLTSLFMVPTMISAVLQQPGATEGGYGRLRAIHYGAAPMPLALLRKATAVFGCDFVQAFGAGTESGWNTVLGSADHRRALAGEEHLLRSVGLAAPGVELRLCDDDWRDVLRGEVGEVVVRSDLGLARTMDFLLFKRFVTGEEAVTMGLVNEAVEPGTALQRALALATQVAQGPQVATRLLKRAVYVAAETDLETALEDISLRAQIGDHHPDAQEGALAFTEKRSAQFNAWLES
jgi:hypothetical protein